MLLVVVANVGVKIPVIDASIADDEIRYKLGHDYTVEGNCSLVDGCVLAWREVFHNNVDSYCKVLFCDMSITMIGFGGMVNKMTTLRVEGL